MQIPDYISASYIKNCYKNTSLSKSKSSKKLASGYRINTAADDAAKLSISEKMRAQIRGLDQGVQNAQDAYSMLQVLDDKVQSCDDLLQRMRELTLQAINGTNTKQDRYAIQQEISELRKEMGRITSNSWESFRFISAKCNLDNDTILENLKNYDFPEIEQPLYDGDKKIPKDVSNMLVGYLGVVQFADDLLANVKIISDDVDILTDQLAKEIIGCALQFVERVKDAKGYDGDNIDWDKVKTLLQQMKSTPKENWRNLEIQVETIRAKTEGLEYDLIDTVLGVTHIITKSVDKTTPAARNKAVKDRLINHTCERIRNEFLKELESHQQTNLNGSQLIKDFKQGKYTTIYRGIQDMVYGRNYNSTLREGIINIQVGANANHAIKVKLLSVDCHDLFEKTALSDKGANEMLDDIDATLKGLANLIGKIGSYQNRLQHTMEYAMKHAEIETNAESRIRDTDYGKEAVEHAKQNLQQQVQETVFAEEKRRKAQINQFLYATNNIKKSSLPNIYQK